MSRFAQGIFTPKNTQKYVGKNKPRYRSGWELTFMTFCDSNNHVLYLASESLIVPYRHPFTGKATNYIPDFFVVYQNKFGKQIAEVVEIKPKKQSIIESKVANAKDRMIVAINHAKWQAAMGYCKQHGYTFRVITEDDLFYNGRKR
jgi:hypothetical protein